MNKIPRPAQYLLRCDDLCPSMDRARWERFLPLIEAFRLQPILGVIPWNADPDLERSSPDPEFWAAMRGLEKAGATIGLHGYRHVVRPGGRPLIPLHRQTEFAGVPLIRQREWIREGLAILRAQGLDPRIWVAPRHGFDRNTLRALRDEGLSVLSDGFTRRPVRRAGLTWIPQQLWGPEAKRQGLWTICLHANTVPDEAVADLRDFVQSHAGQFTSVARVLQEFPATPAGLIEGFEAWTMLTRLRIRHVLRRSRA